MRYSIHQTGDTTWELRAADGTVVGTFTDGAGRTGYDLACVALSGLITAELATAVPADPDAAVGDGLLPERWVSADGGVAQSVRLPGGRNFSDCAWTWRDPGSSLVPLMLQTETDMGHFGAELAGFCEEFTLSGGTVASAGRFYDSEMGVAFRDLLLDGRIFGVSVDPTENVEVEWVCTEYDEDGWCLEGDTNFLAYEIGGVTGTPFPGFDTAAIKLDTASVTASAPARVVASAAPLAPPSAWFSLAEPRPGTPFLDGSGDEVLTDQGDGSLACPLTITDDGLVYGHLARWGQCHVGYAGECVSPPESLAAYQPFHVGSLRTAEGETVAVGSLVVGCDHAPLTASLWEASDHYAHSGSGWADVRASNGELGVWVCGSLRPDVTAEQLRVLRALSLSGDWRKFGAGLELVAGLAVNVPGFPIARESLAAAATMGIAEDPKLRQRVAQGSAVAMVAAGRVSRCPECAKRAQLASRGARPSGEMAEVLALLRDHGDLLRVLDLRTRPNQSAAVEAARARLTH